MKKYILYAEDDLEDFEILKMALAEVNRDIELVQVSNGLGVISHLQLLDQTAYPSLVLMDMNMPLLNGKQTLELLRIDDHFKTIPVRLFSTISSPTDTRFIEQKGSEVIQKPAIYSDWVAVATELAKLCCPLLLFWAMPHGSTFPF